MEMKNLKAVEGPTLRAQGVFKGSDLMVRVRLRIGLGLCRGCV